MGYAFISYSTKNQAYADAMRELFHRNGIDTWMAPYNIPAGAKYAAVITGAIRECSCFVLLLSKDSQDSVAVDSEVELAALTFKKSIITVELEKVVLNDAFTFYIHNKQIIAVHEIDETSFETRQVISAVKAFTGETVFVEPVAEEAAPEKALIETVRGRMILDGRYELRDVIAEGGIGATYRAVDLTDRKNVVVIVGQAEDMQEAVWVHQALIGKTDPGLCKVYDAFVAGRDACLVLEWIDNGRPMSTAKDYRKNSDRRFELFDEDVTMLFGLVRALNGLHEDGIVHGNIRPSNILLLKDGKNRHTGEDTYRMKLMDYSCSFFPVTRQNSEEEYTYPKNRFSAPEELRDYRSDIYSLGMVCFQWFAGNIPERKPDGMLDYDSVEISNEYMMEFLKKATAFDPWDRHQTAQDFYHDLMRFA